MEFRIQQNKVTKMAKKRMLEIKKKLLENNFTKISRDCLVKERLLTLTALTDLILNEFESMFGQDKDANTNSTYKMFTPVSIAGSSYFNLGGSIPINAATLPNADLSTDPLMLDLKDTEIFSGAYDDEVEGAVADLNNLELFIMDVKSAFLYGTIEEEVYVCQPPGFEDLQFPDKVYKVEKALYGLHQAPRAWYETLSTYLLDNRFRRGIIDKNLFIKKDKGELTFFLGLQVMQRDDGIFISQDKYVADILKKFDFSSVKIASILIETNKALLKDEEAEDMDEMHNRRLSISWQDTDFMAIDSYEKRLVQVIKIHTDQNVTDLLIKALDMVLAMNLDLKLVVVRLILLDMIWCCWAKVSTARKKVSTAEPKLVLLSQREDDRVVRATTTATSLEAEQESGNIHKTRSTTTLKEPTPQGTGSGGRPRRHATTLGDIDAQTRFETASKQSHDPPLSKVNTSRSGEDSMEHQDDLIDIVPPTPYDSPLSGGHTPGSDEDLVITKLQKKVKRLENKQRARTLRMNLFKIGTSKRKSSVKENVSKQGRNLKTMIKEGDDIDDLVEEATENVEGDTINVVGSVNTAITGVSVASALVNTAGVSISTAEPRTPPKTTASVFEDGDLTIAQTLVKMRSEKDKGKRIMQEPKKPPKNLRKAQIQMDEELALRLHEEEKAELERMQRDRSAQEGASNAALTAEFDNVQARMDADALTMSSPNHPTSDIEDAFSLNFHDYFPATSRNNSPNSSDDFTREPDLEEPNESDAYDHLWKLSLRISMLIIKNLLNKIQEQRGRTTRLDPYHLQLFRIQPMDVRYK
uniref:Reverse transcriptase Ty1/copia-type domain-containing protein n=1 Tax=Tanacetum cinerariifolium TaxID=118510 RepID=A0A699GT68_TANCI|nr:hypothetical protein [Tanacetum cinerariifolium]